ncbi:hypothetical protein BSL78_08130, partial [Apostichopus japonicus]
MKNPVQYQKQLRANEFGLPLTCEAVASEDGQACARLAHVRLDKTDTAKEQTDTDKSSGTWIVLLVLLIVVSGLTVFLLINSYAIRKKYTQMKTERTGERKSLLDEKTLLEDTKTELEATVQTLNGEKKALQ